jgi:hypothetical protein
MPTEMPPTTIPEATEPPYQPAGFYVVPANTGSVIIYDRSNQVVTQLSAPGLYGDNPSFAHLAGHLSNGPDDLSLAFFSWDTQSLMFTNGLGVNPLMPVENFYMLAGIPGMPYIAYTRLEYADSGLRSYLTVGELASLPDASPIMTVSDTGSYAVRPLAVAHDQGQPLGVYYTSVPYGIGGDIVFEPRRSLSYLELSSYQSREILGISTSPAGFSPDLTWMAYVALHSGSMTVGPMTIAPFNNLNSPFSHRITSTLPGKKAAGG